MNWVLTQAEVVSSNSPLVKGGGCVTTTVALPPWVSVPTICFLSPNTFFVLGERARVRGKTLVICENHASC